MNTLLKHRYRIREHLIFLIGLCLCGYFVYHAAQGERSFIRLVSLQQQQVQISTEYEELKKRRVALENKVINLRPHSLNTDLLEERVRLTLGYKKPGELTVVSH